MWWWGWETLRVSLTRRCKKGLPGGTTLYAKFKVPNSDWGSFTVQDFLHLKKARDVWIRSTLSGGSLASIFSEPRIMAINSKTMSGTWVFLVATGITRFLNVRSMLDNLWWQALLCRKEAEAGSIIKNHRECGRQMRYSTYSQGSTQHHLSLY